MVMKYLENNMREHNVTTCPIFWAPQQSSGAQYASTPDQAHDFWRPGI